MTKKDENLYLLVKLQANDQLANLLLHLHSMKKEHEPLSEEAVQIIADNTVEITIFNTDQIKRLFSHPR